MKPGTEVSHEAVAIIAHAKQIDSGRIVYQHPRNGRVVLVMGLTGWFVESVERPDPS